MGGKGTTVKNEREGGGKRGGDGGEGRQEIGRQRKRMPTRSSSPLHPNRRTNYAIKGWNTCLQN